MGGRHRVRGPDPRGRWLLATAVSVLAVSGVTAATVLGVGSPALPRAATSASLLAPPAGPAGSGTSGSAPTGGDPTAGAPAGPDPTPGSSPAGPAATTGPARTPAALLGGLPDGASAVLATSGARTATTARAAVRSVPAGSGTRATTAGTRGGTCEPGGPPRFDDPAHPDEITNRDCRYTDAGGRDRSHDPWTDDQLRASYGQ